MGICRAVFHCHAQAAITQSGEIQILALRNSPFVEILQRLTVLDGMEPDALENQSVEIGKVDRVLMVGVYSSGNNPSMDGTFQRAYAPGACETEPILLSSGSPVGFKMVSVSD